MNRIIAWVILFQSQITSNKAENQGTEVQNRHLEHPKWSLLNNELCGLTNSDRIIGGTNASLGAYPWIARIGYSPKYIRKEPDFRCGGTVINEFYVVTAAHCIENIEKNMRLSRIRLGEHNTATNPDCEGTYCNDPYKDYEPAKIMVHEKYGRTLQNDLALIRVTRKIQFTEFIRPICIMKDRLLTKDFVGQTAEVAGWGIFNINEPELSTILQTVKLPVVELKRCVQAYRKSVPIGSSQLCVGGTVGHDSCGGDSGGPLMKVDVDSMELGPRYYLLGVVSYGAKLCGESSLPGVYTKLSDYLAWILDHLEP